MNIATAFLLSTAGSMAAAQQVPPFDNCEINTYYSGLSTTDRTDMHTLIDTTHRVQLPYTSSDPDVWDALIDLDSGDVANPDSVNLIYGDRWVPSSPQDPGTCQYWNREHLWPRSRGVGSSGKDNTDLHHLRPSDCNVNAARSNLYFGECGVTSTSTCIIPADDEAAIDTAKDTETFLPPADRRGDIARAILYMDLRYDGDDGSTLDLVVSDCPETVPNGAGMGYLSQLLQWHLADPPDDEEKQRNYEICANWQGNRNPFVDFPDLAFDYHGGIRQPIGSGQGYDCTVDPPPPPTTAAPPSHAGTCSDDGTTSCSTVDDCSCGGRRNLLSQSSLRGSQSRELEASALIITGVLDGPLPGGLPKMVELYALKDVADLSAYGVGSANNGGGSDGQEYTLSGSTTAGSFITVSSESSGFLEYFGTSPNFVSGAVGVNGDDAIELFFNGAVVDTYGNANVDGTNQAWEYLDGFAYRNTVGSGVFDITEWDVSGKNALDGCNTNSGCSSVFPFQSFTGPPPAVCECILPSTTTTQATTTQTTTQTTTTVQTTTTQVLTPSPTSNPTSSPSKAPVLVTTVATSTQATTTTTTVNCIDDDTWFYNTRKGPKGCSWVGQRTSKRCSKVGDDGTLAYDSCPKQCNPACI